MRRRLRAEASIKRIVDFLVIAAAGVLLNVAADSFGFGSIVKRAAYDLVRYIEIHGCTIESSAGAIRIPFFGC